MAKRPGPWLDLGGFLLILLLILLAIGEWAHKPSMPPNYPLVTKHN